jgi:hypothetical protein
MPADARPTFLARPALVAWFAAGLAGCAAIVAAPAPQGAAASVAPSASAAALTALRVSAASAAASAASAAAAGATAPGQPPPFATVIRDAKKIDGLFTLWQKDEKVWIELRPEDFNTLFFFSPKLAKGIGEAGLFAGSMVVPGSGIRERLIEFRRVYNTVQLVAVNTDFFARDPKSPEARAVAAGFAPSLLSSVAVASAAHPERRSVLIEAGPLLLNDLLGIGTALQRAYRQGYALEGRNTQFSSVRGSPDQVVFNYNAHYYTPSLSTPQAGGPPGLPQPTLPRSVPDPRSIYLGVYVAFSKLPDKPMTPRLADARIGSFSTLVHDFSDDVARSPRVRYAERWRLEKKDPAAELSEPVKPITYWLDNTIPLKYRDAIKRGVLEWNKAFERIGFKDAVRVEIQPDDADFDTLDVNRASIRWMTTAQPWFGAIGPTHVDPRTGEILDADIGIDSLTSRALRSFRSQVIAVPAQGDWQRVLQLPAAGAAAEASMASSHGHAADEVCLFAELAGEQLSYALDVLAARGEIDPDSPEAQQFVLDYLTETAMHEVGHTLGLRHNFRASRVMSERQLSDPEFTAQHGLSGSVMEYLPINLARPGERGGAPFQTTLGAYDLWAIEYLYKPIAADLEKAELQRIAARSNEPQLAFATDEDALLGVDPEALQMDLGDDPIAFAEKRLAIVRDLIARQERRTLDPDKDYAVLRRSISYAVDDAATAAGILMRQIGGVRTLRDHPGSGRDPLQPLPAAQQRRALDVLARGVFAPDAFDLSPSLQRKLAPDFAERFNLVVGNGVAPTAFPLADIVIGLQRAVLGHLMGDGLAAQLLDGESKVDHKPGSVPDAFRLSELYTRLDREIWSELGAHGDIPATRRELQREYLNRLANTLLRPSPLGRVDARSLLRVQARGLLGRIKVAARRHDLSPEAAAHLADSAQTLGQALAARLQRAGV